MKNLKSYGLLAASAGVMMLAACGEDSTTNNFDNTAVESYTEKSLPDCTKNNEGALAYVKTDETLRVCYDAEWFVINGKDGIKGQKGQQGEQGDEGLKGEEGADGTGCTVTSLADSTGLKLTCDGDSIGVVLNGEKGDQGDDGLKGEAGSDCVPCQTETLADNSGYKIICGGDSVAVVLHGKSTDIAIPASSSSRPAAASSSSSVKPAVSSSSVKPAVSSSSVKPAESSSSVKPAESSSSIKPAVSSSSVKPAESSSSEKPVVSSSSIKEEEKSSSSFKSAYDNDLLPFNFNRLLELFEVVDYETFAGIDAEEKPFTWHIWKLFYSPAFIDAFEENMIIETINAAAEGTGFFDETPYSFTPGEDSEAINEIPTLYTSIYYSFQPEGHSFTIKMGFKEYPSK